MAKGGGVLTVAACWHPSPLHLQAQLGASTGIRTQGLGHTCSGRQRHAPAAAVASSALAVFAGFICRPGDRSRGDRGKLRYGAGILRKMISTTRAAADNSCNAAAVGHTNRRTCLAVPVFSLAIAAPLQAWGATKLTEEELLKKLQRKWAAEGKQCKQTPYVKYTLGSLKTFLVDMPNKFSWSPYNVRNNFSEKVGGINVMSSILEERVVAKEPYDKWIFSASVDTVQINNVADVGEASQIAQRVAGEKSTRTQDGAPSPVKIISATRGQLGVMTVDTIEYLVATPKGSYHYLLLNGVLDGRLYNVTSEVPESLWPEVEPYARAAIASTQLCSTVSRIYSGAAGMDRVRYAEVAPNISIGR